MALWGRPLVPLLAAANVLGALLALWTWLPAPVEGVAVDPGLRPVAGAVASVAASNGFTSLGRSDRHGRFALEAPHWPVAWTLTIWAPGFLPAPSRGGRVVVHRLPEIAGQAIDDTGQPLSGALVSAGSVDGPVRLVTTDSEGLFRIPDLPRGLAQVTAALDSHEAVQRLVPLSADESSRQLLVLARHLARLSVGSDPPGQPVLLDGQPAAECQTTPCELAIPVGKHTIRIESDLYVPWAQEVTLQKGDALAASAKLERKTGTLTVTAPAAGELTVDGQEAGAGPWSGLVATGEHSAAFRSATTWPAFGSVRVDWNQPAQIGLAGTQVTPGDTAGFLAGLQSYLAAAGGQYGVYLEELGSGRSLEWGDNTSMEAASVIKLPLALYLLHQVDSKQLKLDDKVQLADGDFMGGTGTLAGTATSGSEYSIQDLLGLLIQQSDNTAWQALDRVLGSDKVDAYAASTGAPDCHQGSDSCTAHEAGVMMAQLARGKLLSPESTSRLLGLLESTAFNDRLNYYLSDLTIAHKVGMDGGVMNDVGVVYLRGDPFVISVFTQTGDGDTGIRAIRDIARAAARLYGR